MRVIITAATDLEMAACAKKASQLFKKSKLKISFHATGIGMLASGVKLTQLATTYKPDLIIQMGIAGSYIKTEPLGKVMVVSSESIADLGVRENGVFKDLFETRLLKDNEAPFKKRKLINQGINKVNVLKTNTATAVTINEISTSTKRIKEIIAAHSPVLESMEGAALHYVGRITKTPFIQIRAVSNYVGERNKAKWKLKESIEQLEAYVLTYLATLENGLKK
ncbi:MAG: futalosine hydrolase [Bacteroidota bacterium]|jgi:futalosine hydrolase